MKIGIFGGAFNPPHIGHVRASGEAASVHKLDLLIVIPTGIPPHKEMPPDTPPPKMRLEMAKAAFDGILPDVRISDMEIYSSKSNYTIDTIRSVKEEYGRAALFLLVGNDMYDSLETWKDSAELLKTVTPALLPRDAINISSTQIRAMLPQREGFEYVPEPVYSFIIKNRLYGAKPNWDWLRNCARAMLEPKRIAHVDGCELAAMELAAHWGESVDDAREAAILHDITKKLDFNENMCIISENGLVTNNYNIDEQKLLHSLTASLLAKSDFGVSDKVARAIRLHTTGAAGMSMLDKIIYIADFIEPTRDFPGVEQLRSAAYENIDKAMCMGLQIVIDDLTGRGIPINSSTLEAISDYS